MVLLTILVLSGCGTKVPYYGNSSLNWKKISSPDDSLISHSVYLMGNIDLRKDSTKTLHLLQSSLEDANKASSSLVILGDIRTEKTASLKPFLNDLNQKFNGEIFFLPGDKDWSSGGKSGKRDVTKLEDEIESNFAAENVFLPDNACPGPETVLVAENLVIVFTDSQWWLHTKDKPEGNSSNCKAIDKFSYLLRLEEILELHKEKNILLVQHHPLFSNGNRGGFFSFKDHVFPLTFLQKSLYLPLPVIGSVYPILRYLGISKQDIAHPRYTRMKEEMLSIIENRPNITLVAAHDYSLQYQKHKETHHVVSGASSSTSYTQRKNQVEFAYQHTGLAKINYYRTGESWLEFIIPAENNTAEVAYRTNLNALNPKYAPLKPEDLIDFTDSTNVIAAGPEYEASKRKRFFLGDHYRAEWTEPVEVPLLDFGRVHGGMEILKKGGGNQTISMEAQDSTGLLYDIRSVNKDPKGAVPSPLLNTFAQDIVQDQISSAHPYGALAIPKMEKALGLYHPTPELYQIPYSPLLGQYYDDFAGMMVLKQLELDEDLSAFDQFGNPENVVSESSLYRHLQEDNDNEFDARMFIKARLFDNIVGDWDRHDGQWGFAEFEKEDKGSVFKPIAKDRDQVFAKFDGLLPYLASRKWAVRKFSHFDDDFGDIIGLNYNGRYIDRRLLSGLEWKHWEEAADSIQILLTDETIDAAMKDLPKEVYEFSGPEIAAKIKARRKGIKSAARQYYEVLAKDVDVVASDKHEFFEIERLENGDTRLRYYKTKKEGNVEQKLFDRTFLESETDEVRIYTREGNDSILINGSGNSKILLRIIGGSEKDVVIDKTTGKNIIIYDDYEDDNLFVTGNKAKIKRSDNDDIHKYDLEAFKYNYAGPGFLAEINPDDGLYFGGGVKIKTYGFRKEPAASEHSILASIAFATGAYNAIYEGTFYSLFGKNLDLGINLSTFGPRFVFNYFGQGNNSKHEVDDIDFYRVKLDNVNFSPTLQYRFNRALTAGLGPHFSYYYVRNDNETILNSLQFDQPDEIEKAAYFTGGEFFLNWHLVNHPAHPTKGIKWNNTIAYNKQLNNQQHEFTHLASDLSLYYTPQIPVKLTAAVRLGVAANIGNYKFYQSNFLGGSTNLRGFRRTRFAGETILFNNTELRLEVSEIRNYLFTGKWGLSGFIDHGKVVSDFNEDDKWHSSAGPGLWLNAVELLVLSAHYGFSEEGGFFNLKIGHFF